MTPRRAVLWAAGLIDGVTLLRVPDAEVQGRAAGALLADAMELVDAGVHPADLRRLMVAGGAAFERSRPLRAAAGSHVAGLAAWPEVRP